MYVNEKHNIQTEVIGRSSESHIKCTYTWSAFAFHKAHPHHFEFAFIQYKMHDDDGSLSPFQNEQSPCIC